MSFELGFMIEAVAAADGEAGVLGLLLGRLSTSTESERLFTRKRITEAVAWRLGALYDRLPLRLRAWVADVRARHRAREGVSNFDHARLTTSFSTAWQELLREDPTAREGDYLEFGVFYGSSLACMHEATAGAGLGNVRLFGFDSFEGFPESAHLERGSTWFPGQCRSSLELAQRYLRKRGVPEHRVTLIPGWFSASLTADTRRRHGITRASVLMVDCDLYSSTREALAFAAPLIGRAAVIYFDDWNAAGIGDLGEGERRAFEEFLAENPDIRARELQGLNYKGKSDVKVFLVTRR